MTDKTVILGIFAGRSGSKSLSKFLNQQPDTLFSWEASGFNDIPSLNSPRLRFTQFWENTERFVGDIDYHWIWHLGDFWQDSAVKIIYLYRDPNEIADSFWNYLKNYPFEAMLPSETHKLVFWPFNSPTATRDAIYRTVRQYQAEVDVLAFYHPNRIIHLGVDKLNDLDTMMRLLDEIGYPKDGRVEELHWIRSWEVSREFFQKRLWERECGEKST